MQAVVHVASCLALHQAYQLLVDLGLASTPLLEVLRMDQNECSVSYEYELHHVQRLEPDQVEPDLQRVDHHHEQGKPRILDFLGLGVADLALHIELRKELGEVVPAQSSETPAS